MFSDHKKIGELRKTNIVENDKTFIRNILFILQLDRRTKRFKYFMLRVFQKKKVSYLLILKSSRENHISPLALWTDGRTDKVNLIIESVCLLQLSICNSSLQITLSSYSTGQTDERTKLLKKQLRFFQGQLHCNYKDLTYFQSYKILGANIFLLFMMLSNLNKNVKVIQLSTKIC